MKGTKASTKTEQPEWAMEIAREFVAAIDKPTVMGVPLMAGILAQSPTIKELVGAARELSLHANEFHCGTFRGGPRCSEYEALLSALKPFKASTGGG